MSYYLGVDGGGSKTAAVILNAEGVECGRGVGGPGNIATNDDGALVRALDSAVEQACLGAGLSPSHRFDGACAGVAGYSVETRRDAFEAILRSEVCSDEYRVAPDYLIAFWGATHGAPGIVMIAGTGAVCFGKNAGGAMHREDGLGYLLGDRGSGFNLGLRVLRYTLDRLQENALDPLSEAVLAHTGAQSQGDVLHWLYGNFSPDRVAAIAPVVGALAETGDPVARAHVTEMARRLRHTVRQTRHKLWLPWDVPVYLLGGLWRIGPFLRSEFANPTPEEANDSEPDQTPGGQLHIAEPKNDPAHGAALLSMRRN